MTSRSFDVVVFGATGFTGRLVAEYLAGQLESSPLRWAVAGRDRDRLEALAASLTGHRPEVMVADVADPASLDALARSTRVVLNLAGPYLQLGEPVVKACIEAGTDQVDLTGEPGYVAKLVAAHDEAARQRGVRIVTCCGFDSVPHDLGAMWTARQLPQNEPIVMSGIVQAKGTFSGGTWSSALESIGRPGETGARIPLPPGATRRVHGRKPRVRRDDELGAWLVPLPTIDPRMVLRSASVVDGYGTDFTYEHLLAVRRTSTLAGLAVGVGGLLAASRVKALRTLLRRLKPSGSGPDEATRARSRFSVTFRARAGEKHLVTRVSGGDPGYTETSKMISQCALSLVEDRERLPARAGILTPAMAFEDLLVKRLTTAGLAFEVLESPHDAPLG